MRRFPLVFAAVALAGCGTVATTQNASPPPAASQAAAQPSAALPLLAIHDPGKLTWAGGRPAPGICHAADHGRLPDPHCTPGATDPAVNQASLQNTICVPGWTATVRPPSSETSPAKYDVFYPAYGIGQGTASELDHLVPLTLGGASDSANLWPEVGQIPNPKDQVEVDLNHAVCDGKVTLQAAQMAIAADWTTAEQKLGLRP